MDVQFRVVWVLLRPAVFSLIVMGGERFSQVGTVSAYNAFDCFGQIVQEVPGVGHLLGLRGARLGSVTE